MTALVYRGPWEVELSRPPEPKQPRGVECLVAIRASGICGTDLGIVSGRYPALPGVILGHEAAGEVVAVGDAVTSVCPGDRVAVDPTYHCGVCRMCRTGRRNHCNRKDSTEAGVSSDGTFTNYYRTEERFLYRYPSGFDFAFAALSEPLACVLTGVAALALRPGYRLAVLGAGPIGLLYALALKLQGLNGIFVETAPARLERCPEILGSSWRAVVSLAEACELLGGERPLDLIVDTTGALAQDALARLAPGGQLLLVGLRKSAVQLDPGRVVNRGLRIVGSVDALGTFTDACDLIASGRIPVQHLVTHRLPLDEAVDAMALLGCDVIRRELTPTARALKVVLEPVPSA